jgi:phosphatidylserine/phosphatidylglycerophosphate/cardiolipin synthase-like enzyme
MNFKKIISSLSLPAFVLFFALSSNSPSALATIYPKAANTEVVYLGSGPAAVAAVNQVVSETQTSFNAIFSTWQVDTVGSAFIRTLRTLANRKIKITAIYDTGATGIETNHDFSGEAAALIADSTLARPAHVITATTIDKFESGLAFDDYIHEKMIILDAGTPNMRIIVQGGNWTDTASEFVDCYFMLRPIQPTLPWVGENIFNYYRRTWSQYSKIFSAAPTQKPSAELLSRFQSYAAYTLPYTDQQKQYAHTMQVIHQGPAVVRNLDSIQFQPKSVQFVTNDLLENAVKHLDHDSVSRLNYPDDISKIINQKIAASQSILLANYGGEYNARLKAMLQKTIANPEKEIELVTNGPDAFEKIAPAGSEFAVAMLATAWAMTVEQLEGYLEIAAPHQNLKVSLSNRYRHMKLGIADNTVWSGSANLTVASSTKNGELMFFYEDKELAKFMRAEIQQELKSATFFELSLAQAKDWVSHINWGNRVLSVLLNQYQ